MLICLHAVEGCFHVIIAEMTDHMAPKAEHIYCLALYNKFCQLLLYMINSGCMCRIKMTYQVLVNRKSDEIGHTNQQLTCQKNSDHT